MAPSVLGHAWRLEHAAGSNYACYEPYRVFKENTVKWLILILAAYILYRLFANDFSKKKTENKAESAAEMERKVAAGEMVKDPECGAYVAVDGSVSVRDGDKVHRFCSYECRDKFLQRLEEGGRELPPREE